MRMMIRGLAAVATAALVVPAPAAAEKVTFLTSWYAQAEHGGFYQAQATGLYERAGLEVDIRMGGPQVNGMQLLMAGEVDAIMGYDIQVLKAIEQGLPAVTVAASFQSDLQGMMTHADVADLGGLKDKTILVATSGRTTWWPWLKAKYGYTDAQTAPYTFNLQPFFVDPDTAQQAYPSSEPFQAQQKGVPVNFHLFAADGYPPYGTTIVTTRDKLDGSRETMRGFVKASMQGWKDYLADPAPANALIKEANPKMGDEQIAFGVRRLTELGVVDGGGEVTAGTMTETRWKATYDYLVTAGLIGEGVDWKRAFTTEFMADLATN